MNFQIQRTLVYSFKVIKTIVLSHFYQHIKYVKNLTQTKFLAQNYSDTRKSYDQKEILRL